MKLELNIREKIMVIFALVFGFFTIVVPFCLFYAYCMFVLSRETVSIHDFVREYLEEKECSKN